MEAIHSLPSAASCFYQREHFLPAASATPSSHFCGELCVPSLRVVSPRRSTGVRAQLQPDDAGGRPLSSAHRSLFHHPASTSCRHHASSFSRHQRSQIQSAKKTYSSFDDLLNNTESALLVDFYATWCGPCQFMVPVLDDVGRALKDKVRIVKIDSEKYPNIASRYGVQALPTLVLFQNGQPIDRLEGAMTAPDLIRRIEEVLSTSKAKARD